MKPRGRPALRVCEPAVLEDIELCVIGFLPTRGQEELVAAVAAAETSGPLNIGSTNRQRACRRA
jgi:hypothetical protein